jgi:hypothetical protein
VTRWKHDLLIESVATALILLVTWQMTREWRERQAAERAAQIEACQTGLGVFIVNDEGEVIGRARLEGEGCIATFLPCIFTLLLFYELVNCLSSKRMGTVFAWVNEEQTKRACVNSSLSHLSQHRMNHFFADAKVARV